MDDDPQHRAIGFISNCSDLVRTDSLTIDHDATSELIERRSRGMAINQDLVLFFKLVTRMCNAISECAIIGQKQQARCLPVQTTDGHNPFRHIN
jgi:hypothetical protein